jgi:ATP-dependent Clp protease protease subunit
MSMRTIVFAPAEEVDPAYVAAFLETFLELDSTKGTIKILICTFGGWSEGGMAIFDAIRASKNKVITVATGLVASIGVLIHQAGDERLMTENAFLFFHMSGAAHEGTVKQVVSASRQLERIHERYERLIAERAGLDVNTVRELCAHDTYVDKNLAHKLSLINGI